MAEPGITRRLIVGRAVVAGVLAGGVTGLVIGTATFPIVGTGLGAAAGVAAGACLGLANGAVLAGLSRWTSRWLVFALAAGMIYGAGVIVGAALAFGGWQRVPTSGWQPAAFVAWCAGLGFLLGPAVVRTRGPGMTRLARFAGYGAAGAAVLDSVAGLAVGLAACAPTAPFALIEGSLLAGPPGALFGALLAFVPTRRPANVP